MTMPLLMNCEHQPEGLCDKCRKEFEGQCDDDHHAMMNGPRIRQSLGLDKLSNEDLALKISTDSVWKLKFKKVERALRDLMARCKFTQGEIFYQQVKPEWHAAEDALGNENEKADA